MAANPVPTTELKPIPEQKTTIEERIAELRHKRAEIEQGGGKKRIKSITPTVSSRPASVWYVLSIKEASRK
jgi:hypothetical protein